MSDRCPLGYLFHDVAHVKSLIDLLTIVLLPPVLRCYIQNQAKPPHFGINENLLQFHGCTVTRFSYDD